MTAAIAPTRKPTRTLWDLFPGSTPPLSPQEEREAFRHYRDPATPEKERQQIRDRIVRANVRFVVQVAQEYGESEACSAHELVAEGCCGLLEAMERFDPERGFKFISYAVWWIRQAILAALPRHTHLITRPGHLVHLAQQCHKARHGLDQTLGRLASVDEILDYLAQEQPISAPLRQGMHTHTLALKPLDAPIGEEEDAALCASQVADPDALDPAQEVEAQEMADRLRAHLDRLTAREQQIIRLYFGLDPQVAPLTLAAIGAQVGLTRERVRQLKDHALHKLRASLTRESMAHQWRELPGNGPGLPRVARSRRGIGGNTSETSPNCGAN